jgi:hypothetical protein
MEGNVPVYARNVGFATTNTADIWNSGEEIMARRYNVGIDVDGVLACFVAGARRTMQTLFAGRPDDGLIQTSWAFESLGITQEEEKIFWRHVDNTPNWWLGLRPMPHTLTLPELVRNHRCVFITNRQDGSGMPIEMQTTSWLRANFGLSEPTVLICKNKGPVVHGLDLDFYIDDRPKNCDEVQAYARDCRVYMCDATYNITDPFPLRVPNFDAFARLIIKEANCGANN